MKYCRFIDEILNFAQYTCQNTWISGTCFNKIIIDLLIIYGMYVWEERIIWKICDERLEMKYGFIFLIYFLTREYISLSVHVRVWCFCECFCAFLRVNIIKDVFVGSLIIVLNGTLLTLRACPYLHSSINLAFSFHFFKLKQCI